VRGAARADDAQGTPTQSHISPSILVSEFLNISKFPTEVPTHKQLPGENMDPTTGYGPNLRL